MEQLRKYLVWSTVVAALLLIAGAGLLLIQAARSRATSPVRIGLVNGLLQPCSDSPNCVSSVDPRDSHHVAPLSIKGEATLAQARLLNILGQLPEWTKIFADTSYTHFTHKSAFFGFVDDIEFHWRDGDETIHVRSCSRIGHFDFGANLARINQVRRLFF